MDLVPLLPTGRSGRAGPVAGHGRAPAGLRHLVADPDGLGVVGAARQQYRQSGRSGGRRGYPDLSMFVFIVAENRAVAGFPGRSCRR